MRRYWLTCPLTTFEPPPAPAEQVDANGYHRNFRFSPTCRFAQPAGPTETTLWTDGETSNATPDWMARNYRCTTHNRRPSLHQRSYSADYFRERMFRAQNTHRTIRYTDREELIGIGDNQPYPDDWPHRHQNWGTTVWVPNRPPVRTSHSAW